MGEPLSARIVRIGNSQGIRIPKPLLEQLGIEDEVELLVEGDQICIRARRQARAGWAEQFRAMAEQGEDYLVGGEWPATQFDTEEWEW